MTRHLDQLRAVACAGMLIAGFPLGAAAQRPLGSEFALGEDPEGDQEFPYLVPLGGEAFLALWVDQRLDAPIRGSFLAPDGGGSPELGLVSSTYGLYGNPSGHRGAGGELWVASSAGGGPYAQRLALDGSSIGSAVKLPRDRMAASYGRLFVRDDGSFVACWHGSDFDFEDRPQQIYFRIFDPTGLPVTEMARAWPEELRFQYAPSISGASDGSFVIAWTQDELEADPGDGNPGGGYDVFLRRFSAGGEPLGPASRLSVAVEGPQALGALECSADGTCAATFSSGSSEPESKDVYFRLWGPDGAALTEDVRVNSTLPFDQYAPRLSMNRHGEFAVTWISWYQDQGFLDVYARLFRASGEPASEEFRVNELPPDRGESLPAIALDEFGSLVVAWESFVAAGPRWTDVYTRRFLRGCERTGATLPLSGGRFELCGRFESGVRSGAAHPWPLGGRTGAFWFFDDLLLEFVVKVIDGCSVNESVWLFAAGLTDVGVDFTLYDRWTGRSRTYWSPPGAPFRPILEIEALPGCAAAPFRGAAPTSDLASEPIPFAVASTAASSLLPGAPCQPSESALCLQSGSFRATAEFTAFDGSQGSGHAEPLSDGSGLFWFFAPDNIELLVKVIDGCDSNGRIWVYTAGLTNLEVRLRVDRVSDGSEWSVATSLGQPFAPRFDILAFPCASPVTGYN